MSNLDKALAAFKVGKFVVVTDDENRENEADLILLAEKATAENIGFMVRYTSGVICGIINEESAKRLKLPLMVKRNEDNHNTAFTVTGQSCGSSPANTTANATAPDGSSTSFNTSNARPMA